VDVSDLMRRMVKESLLKFDGRPLFPERIAYTVPYKLSDGEAQLYTEVTDVSDHVKLSKFGHRWSRPPTSHRSNPTPQASQLMPQIAHIIHWDSIPPYLRQYWYEIVERSDWSKRWQRRISKPPPRYRQHERSLDLVHCHLLIEPGPNQLSI
jgi:hypothetical protein